MTEQPVQPVNDLRITQHEEGGACWCGWISIRCRMCKQPFYGHELVHLDGKSECICRPCAEAKAKEQPWTPAT